MAGKKRATESGLTSTHGMTAVISSPYFASSAAHAEAAALAGQLALQRADLPGGGGGSNGRPASTCGRQRRGQVRAHRAGGGGEPADRPLVRGGVEHVQPGGVGPLGHRGLGHAALERADGVVGGDERR